MQSKARVVKLSLVLFLAVGSLYLYKNCCRIWSCKDQVFVRQFPNPPGNHQQIQAVISKLGDRRGKLQGNGRGVMNSLQGHPVHYWDQKPVNESRLQRNNSKSSNYLPAPPLPPAFHALAPSDINGMEKFVFFVGYGRSGHSMVAGIMDAHPDIIVAHEFYLFDKLADKKHRSFWTKKNLLNRLYFNSFISASSGWRADKKTSKGYNLNLKGSWQGQFRKLRVIGDKTAGATVMLYHSSPALFKDTLRRLHEITGVPLRVVHVVRNPYDMIATVALYQASSHPDEFKVNATRDRPFNNASYIQQAMFNILNKALAVQGLSKLSGFELLEVYLEDLIRNSREVIHKICRFLEIPCSGEYVKICRSKIYPHVSQSRHLVVWPDFVIKTVERMAKGISFFKRYSFED